MAQLIESHWDLADTVRLAGNLPRRRTGERRTSPVFRRSHVVTTSFTLYAVHIADTKLDYVWRGPAQVIHKVNPQVYIVEPIAVENVRPFPVHIQRLRRFAFSDLGITEQLRMDVLRDHPDNVVQKLTDHRFDEGLWCKVRWLGFTATRDSWQRADVLAASCPDMLLQYYRKPRTRRTPELVAFMRREFPTADQPRSHTLPDRHETQGLPHTQEHSSNSRSRRQHTHATNNAGVNHHNTSTPSCTRTRPQR